ncbi:HNH endonuclease [Dyadobacter bucti]|uniref:HNH endonuclease n=1 Tax=Dyadobacter bucti TaxID=2572203 RepID=UPI0035B613E3
MHRQIMGFPSGMEIDHIDRQKLNNCRSNLRICTKAENTRNSKAKGSSLKGTTFIPRLNKWMARIRVDGKLFHLGVFSSVVEASKAYDDAAKVHFREFAFLNNF